MTTDAPAAELVWIDGEVVELAAARVSPLDHGLTVGDGVFETLRVVRGVPFAWRRHDERLRASAGPLGIAVPDGDALRAGADALLAAVGLSDGRLRITVTAGAGPPGSTAATGPPVTIMVATPLAPVAPSVDVVVAPWTRNERGACAGLKTISYAANVRALAYAHEHGAGEALLENTAGNLCEATGSNLFLVASGVLRTPPAGAGCLRGVTRALVLELASEVGVPAEEVDVTLADLRGADEAFLSSTTRDVQPIAHVEGHPLPWPGPVSRRLTDAFAALVERDLDP